MRALVTGGSGFVGGHLCAHLSKMGDEVVSTDAEVDVAELDALRASLLGERPEVVYHLAALSHVGESWSDPTDVVRVNVLGSANVLAAARAISPPPLLIMVSSADAYGSLSEEDLPVTESSPLRPVSPYGASKAAAEHLALQAWRGFSQPVIVMRPFNHFGPGQPASFAVSAFAKRIVEAQREGAADLAVGTLSTRRDYTDVRDVVRAYRMVALSGRTGSVYNVCSGKDLSLREVADRLVRLAGVDLELRVDPALVRPVDLPVLRGDAGALRRDTGWEPTIALDATLADILAYWRGRYDD
ncbi:MAG: GDP-mannose 4,6-dehydratase [Acidimicrobiales bacterium]